MGAGTVRQAYSSTLWLALPGRATVHPSTVVKQAVTAPVPASAGATHCRIAPLLAQPPEKRGRGGCGCVTVVHLCARRPTSLAVRPPAPPNGASSSLFPCLAEVSGFLARPQWALDPPRWGVGTARPFSGLSSRQATTKIFYAFTEAAHHRHDWARRFHDQAHQAPSCGLFRKSPHS
ncbi:hypothetical protein GWK47_037411 [Chionoecetes opilio]|uniref:Uncharacterized protein n=1 Tax=Chionoecetes opilio TaxID=41210 RepID=A0A8J5D1F6_CHIOP|nr:hypothetical protein GWK47_037411 [Chionoecetes opilio]